MGKKMLYIMNPVAGRMKAKTDFFDIINTFCAAGYELSVAVTQHRHHATELAAAAEEKGFDVVVCSGGDGTARETINGLLKSGASVPFGYIPAGTTNDFGNTLGLPSDPIQAASLICEGKTRIVDVGSFNDTFYTYVAGFGAFTNISYSVSQHLKNVLGFMAYLSQGVKSLTDIKPIKMSVTADGKTYEGEYIFGCVSNSTSVAGLLHPAGVKLDDGKLELILVKAPKTIVEANNVLVGAMSSNFDSDVFTYEKVSGAHIEMPKKMNWTLDGEKQEGSKEIDIKCMHNALTIFC